MPAPLYKWSLLLAVLAASPSVPRAGGEIHGSVRTTDGRVLNGPIRWDRNEIYWDDVLDGQQFVEPEVDKAQGFRFSLFGVKMFEADAEMLALRVPFGHLRSIERRDSEEATLTLKDGTQIRAGGGTSTDLGSAMREILVGEPGREPIRLKWSNIQRVEFSAGPEGPGLDRLRLHGTVETADGALTGYLVWSRNLALTNERPAWRNGSHEAAATFGEMREILPAKGKIVLARGGEIDLPAEPDDVTVSIPGVGHANVPWSEVRKLAFSAAPPSPRYGSFDGGRPLAGTAILHDGRKLSGRIQWDHDEQSSWESVEGSAGVLEYSIRIGNVRSIRRVSAAESRVTVKDGRTFDLSGSNDIDDSNRGILVTDAAGKVTDLRWQDIDLVEFE